MKIPEPYLTRAREQATQAGYADVGTYLEALIEEADFDFPVESRADFLASIREGMADMQAGRGQPLDEAMVEIAKKFNPPVDDSAERQDTLAGVRQGIADFEAGRRRPARDVFTDLARNHNLTRPADHQL